MEAERETCFPGGAVEVLQFLVSFPLVLLVDLNMDGSRNILLFVVRRPFVPSGYRSPAKQADGTSEKLFQGFLREYNSQPSSMVLSDWHGRSQNPIASLSKDQEISPLIW